MYLTMIKTNYPISDWSDKLANDELLQVRRQGVPRGEGVGRRPEGASVPQEVRALRHLREAPQLHDPLQRQGRRHLLQELLRQEVRRPGIQG